MSEVETPEVPEVEPQGQEQESDQLPADHPLVKALAAQKAAIKELKTKANRLDEIEEAKKSREEKDAERIAAEARRADTAEAELLRYKVATEKNVPANAMKFLTGTTREDIEASAKEVLELIGDAGKPRAPKPDPNQGRTPPDATSPQSLFASVLSQQLNNT